MKIATLFGILVCLILAMLSPSLGAEEAIYGCYKAEFGQLRIVDDHSECLPSELPVTLSGHDSGPSQQTVNCAAGEKLQDAIDQARSGDTILVTGVCHEEINFAFGKDNIAIDGQGTGVIDGRESLHHAVGIVAQGVTVRGFTIYGGSDVAVRIYLGGSAKLDGNHIADAANEGIWVLDGSVTMLNNTIRHNGAWGIRALGTSRANIGRGGVGIGDAGPNIIENNGVGGILIRSCSSAAIQGNTIQHNQGSGVLVSGVSQASISNNTINENADDGISVTQNSTVALFTNVTTLNNGEFGVRCLTNSHATGSIGTLNGTQGSKSFDDSCVDELF